MTQVFQLDSNNFNISLNNEDLTNILKGENISDFVKSINLQRTSSIVSKYSIMTVDSNTLTLVPPDIISTFMNSERCLFVIPYIKDFGKSVYIESHFGAQKTKTTIPTTKKKHNFYKKFKHKILSRFKIKTKKLKEEEKIEETVPTIPQMVMAPVEPPRIIERTIDHIDESRLLPGSEGQQFNLAKTMAPLTPPVPVIPDTPILVDRYGLYDMEALHEGTMVICGKAYHWRASDHIFVDDDDAFYQMSCPRTLTGMIRRKSEIHRIVLPESAICPIIPIAKDPMLHLASVMKRRKRKKNKYISGVNNIDVSNREVVTETSVEVLESNDIIEETREEFQYECESESQTNNSLDVDVASSSLNYSEESSDTLSNVVDVGPESSSEDSSAPVSSSDSSSELNRRNSILSSSSSDSSYDRYRDTQDFESDAAATTIVPTTGTTTVHNVNPATITEPASATSSLSSTSSSSSSYCSILNTPLCLYKCTQSAHI